MQFDFTNKFNKQVILATLKNITCLGRAKLLLTAVVLRVFPGSNGKVGTPCHLPSNRLLQVMPTLLLLLPCPYPSCPLSSLPSIYPPPNAPGQSSRRIGAKLPLFPWSNGYVDAPSQIPSNRFLLLLLLLLLRLSCPSPSYSSFSSPTAPGSSSRRIGAKLPLFPGSNGYVGATR